MKRFTSYLVTGLAAAAMIAPVTQAASSDAKSFYPRDFTLAVPATYLDTGTWPYPKGFTLAVPEKYTSSPTWPYPKDFTLAVPRDTTSPTWPYPENFTVEVPAQYRIVAQPVASAPVAVPSGFDWADAGVGIGIGIAFSLMLGAVALIVTRRRSHLAGA